MEAAIPRLEPQQNSHVRSGLAQRPQQCLRCSASEASTLSTATATMNLGLPGWHSIHGPILAYGDDSAGRLQQWCLDNPVVPFLREILSTELPPTPIHGVKFLLGAFGDESIAEVRIDSERSEAGSSALLDLRWPKVAARVARFYVLFVHPLED